MKQLFVFEFKRMRNKKVLYFLPLIIMVIGIVGILLGNVYGNDMNDKVLILNVYNAFSQFAFLFLSFIYISVLADDFNKGSYKFFNQLGYRLGQCMFVKSFILLVVTLVVTDIFVIIYSLIINITDWSYVLLAMCSIDLGLLFILILSNVLSIILKKIMSATVISFALYIVFDFFNLLCYGLTNPCDANSLACVTLGQLAGIALTHDSLSRLSLNYFEHSWLFITFPNVIYSFLLMGVLLFLIRKEKVK